ncbi:MAG: alpha/beta fold hydrolase [Sporichthyaceae bacterium]
MFPTARGQFSIHAIDPPENVPRKGTAILVPGFTGSKEDFLPVLEPLAAAGCGVVALDQRGQYETPGPDDPDAYTVAALGADLLAVAAELPGPVHLVGHSFGGFPVRAAAIADPSAVASATLLCSGAGPITVEREVGRIQTLMAALENFSVPEVAAFIAMAAEAAGEYEGVADDVREFLTRRYVSSPHVALATMAAQLLELSGELPALAASGVPVLVAHGEDDYIWLPAEQASMARELGSRYQVLEGAAHSPAVEKPAETADLLVDFWAECER